MPEVLETIDTRKNLQNDLLLKSAPERVAFILAYFRLVMRAETQRLVSQLNHMNTAPHGFGIHGYASVADVADALVIVRRELAHTSLHSWQVNVPNTPDIANSSIQDKLTYLAKTAENQLTGFLLAQLTYLQELASKVDVPGNSFLEQLPEILLAIALETDPDNWD